MSHDQHCLQTWVPVLRNPEMLLPVQLFGPWVAFLGQELR